MLARACKQTQNTDLVKSQNQNCTQLQHFVDILYLSHWFSFQTFACFLWFYGSTMLLVTQDFLKNYRDTIKPACKPKKPKTKQVLSTVELEIYENI